jgi:hypothetical protein
LKIIKLKLQNGLTFETFKKEVLDVNGVSSHYIFKESKEPDFIIFGPYGNDIPQKSDKYQRIGYFCENIIPDMSICEWAFGIPHEEEILNSKYKRIQWHGLNPTSLVKPKTVAIEAINESKTKFCNFLYSNKVPYRETFFKELSKYKKVDAPGKSMNNMPSIDDLYQGDIWERKRQFLTPYKFTIAFENYVYPGYQTEKLYDAMLTQSIPIYCGDPHISQIFNTQSFINASDLLNPNYGSGVKYLEKSMQINFIDMRPQFYNQLHHRVARKVKETGRNLKMQWQFNGLNYKALVDKIVEIDENPKLYEKMLLAPWFNNNMPPVNASTKNRWIEIFG